jgi:predicted  nucleic acid-binding Zn-ribbon protein
MFNVATPTIKYHTNDEYKAYMNQRRRANIKIDGSNVYEVIATTKAKIAVLIDELGTLKKNKTSVMSALEDIGKEIHKKEKSLKAIISKFQ